jgi:hypothetical protein
MVPGTLAPSLSALAPLRFVVPTPMNLPPPAGTTTDQQQRRGREPARKDTA